MTNAMTRLRFAVGRGEVFLEVDRSCGLDFLEWLGLGRPEFGAVEAAMVRPLCMRRLWSVRRNEGRERFRGMAAQMVRVLEGRQRDVVHFG